MDQLNSWIKMNGLQKIVHGHYFRQPHQRRPVNCTGDKLYACEKALCKCQSLQIPPYIAEKHSLSSVLIKDSVHCHESFPGLIQQLQHGPWNRLWPCESNLYFWKNGRTKEGEGLRQFDASKVLKRYWKHRLFQIDVKALSRGQRLDRMIRNCCYSNPDSLHMWFQVIKVESSMLGYQYKKRTLTKLPACFCMSREFRR